MAITTPKQSARRRDVTPYPIIALRTPPDRVRPRHWFWPVLILASVIYPADDPSAPGFADVKADPYQQEYLQCTGNSGEISQTELLRWRAELFRFTASSNYAEILRKFVDATKVDPRSVLPCQVMAWYAWHKPDEKKTPRKSSDAQPAASGSKKRRDALKQITIDSLEFGCPRDKLLDLLARNLDERVMADGATIEFRPLFVDDRAFPAVLILSDAGLCGISISAPLHSADSLDLVVRSNADDLIQIFSARFGPAGRRYRVGLMEIKGAGLAPVARWEIGSIRLWVGLSRHRGRYCATALLVHEELFAEVKRSGKWVEEPER